jgi:hypothetical protein
MPRDPARADPAVLVAFDRQDPQDSHASHVLSLNSPVSPRAARSPRPNSVAPLGPHDDKHSDQVLAIQRLLLHGSPSLGPQQQTHNHLYHPPTESDPLLGFPAHATGSLGTFSLGAGAAFRPQRAAAADDANDDEQDETAPGLVPIDYLPEARIEDPRNDPAFQYSDDDFEQASAFGDAQDEDDDDDGDDQDRDNDDGARSGNAENDEHPSVSFVGSGLDTPRPRLGRKKKKHGPLKNQSGRGFSGWNFPRIDRSNSISSQSPFAILSPNGSNGSINALNGHKHGVVAVDSEGENAEAAPARLFHDDRESSTQHHRAADVNKQTGHSHLDAPNDDNDNQDRIENGMMTHDRSEAMTRATSSLFTSESKEAMHEDVERQSLLSHRPARHSIGLAGLTTWATANVDPADKQSMFSKGEHFLLCVRKGCHQNFGGESRCSCTKCVVGKLCQNLNPLFFFLLLKFLSFPSRACFFLLAAHCPR